MKRLKFWNYFEYTFLHVTARATAESKIIATNITGLIDESPIGAPTSLPVNPLRTIVASSKYISLPALVEIPRNCVVAVKV